MANRCFILGAGFSHHAGIPLARDLTNVVFQHAYPENDNFLKIPRDIYLEEIKTLFPGHDCIDSFPDFEMLVTSFDELEKYREDYTGNQETGLGPRHLRKTLLKHLGLFIVERCNTTDSLDDIKDFVNFINPEHDRIISFNWDVLLECACFDLSKTISYQESLADAISIYKPHGSVNLAVVSEDQMQEISLAMNIHSIDEEWRHNGNIIYRASNPHDSANRILHPFAEYVVVEPNARKQYNLDWIKNQWKRSLDALCNSDEIYIIGYSLPEFDFRPRILMQLGILWNNTDTIKNNPCITLIDPNADELKSYYSKYLTCEIVTKKEPWIEWFRSLN